MDAVVIPLRRVFGLFLRLSLCGLLSIDSAFGVTFTVTTTADSGMGSLRQAILNANINSGPDIITFQISGTAPFIISPLSPLPSISTPTLIDGTTQNGFIGTPIVELNGASAGGTAVGLQLASSNSTVRGLVISSFSAQGIELTGSSNTIQGNFIGTDTTGTVAHGNTSFGVWVKAPGNVIGGTNSGNLISGNNTGIYISDTTNTMVLGNIIGLTASGTSALGNANEGIVLDGSSGNIIGGTNSGERNIISGNGQSGIYLNGTGASVNLIQGNYIGVSVSGETEEGNAGDGITINGSPGNYLSGGNVISDNSLAGISLNTTSASNNIIQGNFIGMDATGKLAFGNKNSGVVISSSVGNQIGGTIPGSGNVISGNVQDGVFLTSGALQNSIDGNFIGLSAAGTNALSNGFNGISLSGAVSNTIGGASSSAGNTISGNAQNGILISLLSDSGNVILGNHIGTDPTGRYAIPNTLAGVHIQGCSNVIGGTLVGNGNVISGNGQQGVWLVGASGNVTGNVIQGNLIGLDATGTNSLANGNAGVGVTSAAGNQIGGIGPSARNVISANGDAGIFLIGAGTTGNQVLGNYIGTDSSGTQARGNTYEGIYVQDVPTNFIGGSASGAGNLISGNNTRGIWLTNAPWNVVQGNYIGTQEIGINPLGNVFHGIDIDVGATNNTIGGTAPGAGNRIAFAQTIYSGVRVRNGSMNNLISGNCIFSNGGFGIDLGGFGVSPIYDCQNDVPSGTANNGQNYPVLSNAYAGNNGISIIGSLNSGAGNVYTLQFFASPIGDSSSNGEGEYFLAQTNITLATGMCSSNFVVFLPVSELANWVITATATGPTNNTSDFSNWVPLVPVPSLKLSLSGPLNQISIAWTNNAGNFLVLQTTGSLSPPVQWTTATPPTLINGLSVLTLSPTNAGAFYRLAVE
jgi:titin